MKKPFLTIFQQLSMKFKAALIVVLIVLLLAGCNPYSGSTSTPPPEPTSTAYPPVDDAITEGDRYFDAGEFEQAAKIYRSATEANPNAALAHAKLARALMIQGVYSAEGISAIEKAVVLDAENGYVLAVYSDLQLYRFEPSAALKFAERAYQLAHDNPFIIRNLVRVYLANQETQQAWDLLEEVYQVYWNQAETYLLLGDYFTQTADFGAAQAAYQKAAEFEKTGYSAKLELAKSHLGLGSYDKALAGFQSILEQDPDHSEAMYWIASTHLQKNDLSSADQWLQKMEATGPENIYTFLARAELAVQRSEFEAAIDNYQKVLDIDPHNFTALMGIGSAYASMKDCEQSLNHFQDLNDQFPEESSFIYGSGVAYLCDEDLESAENVFNQAIEMRPNLAAAYIGLGQVFSQQERWESAEQAFLEAFTHTTQFSELHTYFGKIDLSTSTLHEAEIELEQAIALDPYNYEAYTFLSLVKLQLDQIVAASEFITKAYQLNPDDKNVLLVKGLVYLEARDNQNAFTTFRKLLALDAENSAVHLYLSIARRNLGQYQEAFQEIESYLADAGEDLTDLEQERLSMMMKSLEIGYEISQEDALAQIKQDLSGDSGFENFSLQYLDLKDHQCTLVVDLPMDQEMLISGEYLERSGLVSKTASSYLPRTYPRVNGGLKVNIRVDGQIAFSLDSSLDLLADFADTLIDFETLVFRQDHNLPTEYDTTTQSSFDQIYTNTAEIRGLEYADTPDQRTISAQELNSRARLEITNEVAQTALLEIRPFQILDIVDGDFNLLESREESNTGSLAGFYIPETNVIYLVTRNEVDSDDKLVLAHESTHALQHQEFNLTSLKKEVNDSDQALALLSLIEGDAEFTMIQFVEGYVPFFTAYRAASNSSGNPRVSLMGEDYFTERLIFPYKYGLLFVEALYQRGGWDQVNEAYRNPPQSSENIMYPQTYFDREAPEFVDIASKIDEDRTNWEIMVEDTIGQFGLYLMLTNYVGETAAVDASRGWGGDQYVLVKNTGTGSEVLMMKIEWDSVEDAEEFSEMYKISMLARPEYSRTIDNFIPQPGTPLIWDSETTTILLQQISDKIYLLIGKDLSELEGLLMAIQN